MTDERWRRFVAATAAVALLVAAIGAFAASAPTNRSSPDVDPASGADPAARVQALHEAGITGENVSVGIVDVTGFDVDHPSLAGRVVAARGFAPAETVANGGRNEHGTAAASLVAATAPDADLYLASFDTADGYSRAVEWLVDQGVDVLVAPVTFYGKPDDGSSFVSRVVDRAATRGVTVVAPAGNLALGHWTGRYDLVRDGTLRFGAGTRNYLLADEDERDLTLWVSWERAASAENYSVDLYWTNGSGSRLVARSQPYLVDDVPNERIVARLSSDGAYYFEVRGPPNATGTRLEIESPTHTFQHRRPAGSIAAPATARTVVAVGAYDHESTRLEPFSAAGPTVDGHDGVDLLAPDRLDAAGKPDGFVGSSAAAPYLAGVVALLLDADPTLSPDEVEVTLERTAVDVGPSGPDTITGHGRLAPRRAIAVALNRTG